MFVNEIDARKHTILKLLSVLFGISGILAIIMIIIQGYLDFDGRLDTYTIFDLIGLLISTFVTLVMGYIYFVGATKRPIYSALVCITLFVTVSSYVVASDGSETPISFILIVTAILLGSIVISIRAGTLVYITSSLLLIAASGFKIFSADKFSVYRIVEDIGNNLMIIFFIGIISLITKIAYDQIEHSYQKALDYASELEELNQSLDIKVKQRTSQLENSLKRQADAVYSAAVVGSVTRPMMHDMATPLSSFGIALDMLKDPTRKDFDEIHSTALLAYKQLNEILSNSRDLMRNQVKRTHFVPYKLIETSLHILQNEINVNRIQLTNYVDLEAKIWGSPNLFIRLSTNLILNAIQELRDSGKSIRTIDISSEIKDSRLRISIKDSGRGIPTDKLDKIFDSEFTSKETETNLGFGLAFVKRAVEEQFKGELYINSVHGESTKITMAFPLKKKLHNQKSW